MNWHQTAAARRGALIGLVALATLVMACRADGSVSVGPIRLGGTGDAPKWDSRSVGTSIKDAPFTPVIVNSNIGRGPTRLALALLQHDQTLVLQGEVTARLFHIDDEPEKNPNVGTLLGSYDLTARTIDTADHGAMRLVPLDRDDRGRTLANVALLAPAPAGISTPAHDGALSTIFTTMVNFNEAGMWGASLQVTTGGKTYRNLLLTFAVLDHTAEPSVGDSAPLTKQKLAKDVANISEIDSSTKPNPAFHDITVADAVTNGKPTLIAFVTPAFCQTRFCGPVLNNVVVPIAQSFGSRVNVIHIEPYDVPAARKGTLNSVPAVTEWNLRSEPFLVVVDRRGIVTAKFEGIVDLDEVKQAIDAALAAK